MTRVVRTRSTTAAHIGAGKGPRIGWPRAAADMKSRIVMLIAAAAWLTNAAAESPADRWNLSEIYPSVAAWNADAVKLTAQMKEFAGCKGHLGDSVARFGRCLGLQADMAKRYFRMITYSSEQLSEDTGSSAYLELDQQATMLGAKFNEAASFMDPELLRLGSARIARFLDSDPALRIYRHQLDQTLRAAPHTLNGEGEALVAQFALLNNTGSTVYTILTDADMEWPTIKLSTGAEVRVDDAGYNRNIVSLNRDDRKRVMDAHYGVYKTYERTLGVTLYSQLVQDSVYSKVRKYPDSITRGLDGDRLPVAVFDTLIAQANANLPTLHRYFRLRAKMMGLPQLKYYDLFPPLAQSTVRFPLAAAKQLVQEAVAPLGRDYVEALEKGFNGRWMDAYPRKNKQSGAHMNSNAYDVHPYVMMNFTDDYDSVTTLAHEWGHAMHTYLANGVQPFVTSNYPIFVAEIASTFNEQLLLDRMLKAAKSDDERLLYLGFALEDLRGTFFMQTMLAEFERNIHARVDQGESLTGETLTKTYCELLKRYSGDSEGVVSIDDAYCIGWARIPHVYNSYYVFQYATSIAASSLFAQRVGQGESGALKRYLDLLRAGGSDYPYELVKRAGADLATPAPYQALFARMNAIMDEIEAILVR
jgi:oligoendopeptidase F